MTIVVVTSDGCITQEMVSGDADQRLLLAGVAIQQHKLTEILIDRGRPPEPADPPPIGENSPGTT